MLCHGIVQVHGVAGIVTVYLLYVKRFGGVCYVVGKEAAYFKGCEVCPSGFPQVDGACLNNNSTMLLDTANVDDLPSGTFCSDDYPGFSDFDQSFCYFEA
jgi:hypothetical protein